MRSQGEIGGTWYLLDLEFLFNLGGSDIDREDLARGETHTIRKLSQL